MPYCAFCSESYRGPLRANFCGRCCIKLQKLELRGPDQLAKIVVGENGYCVHSLYAYSGLVRSCILAYKARGHRMLADALFLRLLEQAELMAMVEQCDAIMPVSSSLWSRLFGRLDLAYSLAHALARHAVRPLVLPPRSLSWRWTKQSWLKRGERRRFNGAFQPSFEATYFSKHIKSLTLGRTPRILILDDVVTTANTLTDLADSFRNIDFQIFTLASAYRNHERTSQAVEDYLC